jgi:hypothetical protein
VWENQWKLASCSSTLIGSASPLDEPMGTHLPSYIFIPFPTQLKISTSQLLCLFVTSRWVLACLILSPEDGGELFF